MTWNNEMLADVDSLHAKRNMVVWISYLDIKGDVMNTYTHSRCSNTTKSLSFIVISNSYKLALILRP
jgi:hypothetical protein